MIKINPAAQPQVMQKSNRNQNQPSFNGKVRFPQGKDEFKKTLDKFVDHSHANPISMSIVDRVTKFASDVMAKTTNSLPPHLDTLISLEEKKPRVYQLKHTIESIHRPNNPLHERNVTIDLSEGREYHELMRNENDLIQEFDPKLLDVNIRQAISSDNAAAERKERLHAAFGLDEKSSKFNN